MKILMILLSGVILVNNHSIEKTQLEMITGTKVVKQGIVPVVAKKNISTKKISAKKNKINKKNVKKSQKTKKYKAKKKKTTKKTYKQTTRIKYNVNEIQSYAYSLVKSYGWSDYDFECLVKLWNRESSWNSNAVNKKSGACGIPQSLPCSKMKSEGSDYRTNYKTQIRWGCKYIKARYGTPSKAWEHSQKKGWY